MPDDKEYLIYSNKSHVCGDRLSSGHASSHCACGNGFDKGAYYFLNKVDSKLEITCTQCDIKKAFSTASKELLVCDARIVTESEVDQDRLSEALKGDKKQRDLLFVAFKLVHAGTNRNFDHFTEEELRAAEKSPIHKPLNWLHGEPNIGVMYDSKFRKGTKAEAAYLEVAAAVWKYKYPKIAQAMVDRHEKGSLQFSMEVWFREVGCSICSQKFDVEEEGKGGFCDHLKEFYSYKAIGQAPKDNSLFRKLHDICFGGGAVVEDPADEEADSLAIASKTSIEEVKNNVSDDKKYSQIELDTAIAAALEKFKSENDGAQALAKLSDELVSTKAALEQKDKDVSKLSEDIETLKTEYATFKAQVEQEKMIVARLDELKKLADLPSDEEEVEALKTLIGSLDEDKFKTFAKMYGKVPFKKTDEEDEEEDDETKKKASKKSKAERLPVGVGNGEVRAKGIQALENFLSGAVSEEKE